MGLLLLCWLLCGGCGQRNEPVTEAIVTGAPKSVVTEAPTEVPTQDPKPVETAVPTAAPTEVPTQVPKPVATETPTEAPTAVPKPVETESPTEAPTQESKPVETTVPTEAPTEIPKPVETAVPTEAPVQVPKPEGTDVTHTHKVATEEKGATCLEQGEKRSYCVSCGVTIGQEYTEPLGHVFEKEVWELPTCQKGGYYNNICTRCGLVECVSQNPLAHEVEDIVLQEGNCMEDTIIQHKCKTCGVQVQEDTRYTNYEVHSWTVEQVDGIEITYCEWCGVAS